MKSFKDNEMPSCSKRIRRNTAEKRSTTDNNAEKISVGHSNEGGNVGSTVNHEEVLKASLDFSTLTYLLSKKNNDEDAVINLLCKSSNKHRRMIAKISMMNHGQNIVRELIDKLGGCFEDVIVGLMHPPIEYLCTHLSKAVKMQDNQTLTDILCTCTNSQIQEINSTYETMFERELADHLSNETEENFKKFITLILSGKRKSSQIDKKVAVSSAIEPNRKEAVKDTNKKEKSNVKRVKIKVTKAVTEPTETTSVYSNKEYALQLFEAGKDQINYEVFSNILSDISFDQLKVVMEEYNKIAGRTLENTVEAEVTGPLQNAYMAVMECAVNRVTYFANILNKAINANATALKRIIISRSEIDLEEITEEYEQLFATTLTSDIENAVTEAYKKVLIRLFDKSYIY